MCLFTGTARIIMVKYDLTASQANAFVAWYQGGATDSSTFIINKKYNRCNFTSRNDYIVFNKIAYFEVLNYDDTASAPAATAEAETTCLKVAMSNGNILEYQMTPSQITSFLNWYSNGVTNGLTFEIDKNYNLGPFSSRKEFLAFDKISDFEVMKF